MRRRYSCLLILFVGLALLAGLYVYLNTIVPRKIENIIEARMPKAIGPAKDYQVHAGGSLYQLLRGKITSLDIHGDDVQLENGLVLDELDINIENILLDAKTVSIADIGSTNITARVAEDDLNSFLTEKHPDVKDLRIELQNGLFIIKARPGNRLVRVPLTAEGTLNIVDNKQLEMEIRELRSGIVNAPGFFRGYVNEKLNPILDTSEWGFEAVLNTVIITPGKVTLTGNADLGNVSM